MVEHVKSVRRGEQTPIWTLNIWWCWWWVKLLNKIDTSFIAIRRVHTHTHTQLARCCCCWAAVAMCVCRCVCGIFIFRVTTCLPYFHQKTLNAVSLSLSLSLSRSLCLGYRLIFIVFVVWYASIVRLCVRVCVCIRCRETYRVRNAKDKKKRNKNVEEAIGRSTVLEWSHCQSQFKCWQTHTSRNERTKRNHFIFPLRKQQFPNCILITEDVWTTQPRVSAWVCMR